VIAGQRRRVEAFSRDRVLDALDEALEQVGA
jgi:hypothetical protein